MARLCRPSKYPNAQPQQQQLSNEHESKEDGYDPSPPPSDTAALDSLVERIQQAIPDSQLYPTLVNAEAEAAQRPYNLPPCQFRRRFPRQAIVRILPFLPQDRFSTDNPNISPRLRKAARAWNINEKEILFTIAFDYARHGQRFFVALKELATTCPDWARCSRELCEQAHDRYSAYKEARPITKTTAGITLQDVKSFLQQLRCASPVDETSSIEDPRNSDSTNLDHEPEDQSDFSFVDEAPEVSSHPGDTDDENEFGCPSETSNLDISIIVAEPCSRELTEDAQEDSCEASSISIADPGQRSPSLASDYGPPLSQTPHRSESLAPLVHSPIQAPSPGTDLFDPAFAAFPDLINTTTEPPPTPCTEPRLTSSDSVGESPSTVGNNMSLSLKRLRFSTELSPLLTPDEADLLLEPTIWVRGRWLNSALGEVCLTQGSKVCLVDSCELAHMARTAASGCQLRNDTSFFGPANVAQSRLIVIPINIANSHWVLGVINKHNMVSIGLHDSLPSQENLNLARELLSHFARAYLPSISARPSTVTPLVTPLQPNTNDCGCFVFAVALFTLAGKQPPVTLHGGLWRRIMIGCLGSEAAAGDVTKYEPPEESFVGLTGLERFRAQKSHMKKWEEEMEAIFEKQLETNTELLQTLRSNTVMAIMVIQQLVRVGEETEQDLGSELEVAKELEAMKVIPPRGQSSCALSSKLDRVKRAVWWLKATQMSLAELDGNMAKAESDLSGQVDNVKRSQSSP